MVKQDIVRRVAEQKGITKVKAEIAVDLGFLWSSREKVVLAEIHGPAPKFLFRLVKLFGSNPVKRFVLPSNPHFGSDAAAIPYQASSAN